MTQAVVMRDVTHMTLASVTLGASVCRCCKCHGMRE